MYIIKNALISIKRNKGRNILLGIIVFVIACATTVTLAIRNSADTLMESYSNKYDITASISVNREDMMANMGQPPSEGSTSKEDKMKSMSEAFSAESKISADDIKFYADSDYIKSYYYTSSLSMNINDFSKVESSDFGRKDGNMPGPNPDSDTVQGDFSITGYSSFDAMSDFINGSYSITDGEISDDFTSNTCAINAELATLNDISVGDTLTLVNPNNEDDTYKLKVSGIFKDSSDSSNEMSMFTGSANTIITNVKVVNDIADSSDDITVKTKPNFVLTSKDAIDNFTKEVTSKGLSEYLTVTTNLDSIENATSSISNTKTFATTFLVVTFVIGGVVLFVLNLINIRQRKYEIGVLRTIGMKKSLLTAQFTTELLAVAIISLAIGAGAGAIMSVPVSNKLLQNEITSSQEEMSNINKNFGKGELGRPIGGGEMKGPMNGVAQVQAFDSIDATVDGQVLAQLFAIGIGLTLISSSACMVSIQRFSPLTILKERT
ncbi:ABC transporter permease [Terrisporobacter sp.]